MTTRCPSLMRATAVSTMRERTDNRGSCVFSWTIELEPVKGCLFSHCIPVRPKPLHTQFDHNGETFMALHAYLCIVSNTMPLLEGSSEQHQRSDLTALTVWNI